MLLKDVYALTTLSRDVGRAAMVRGPFHHESSDMELRRDFWAVRQQGWEHLVPLFVRLLPSGVMTDSLITCVGQVR